MRVIKLGEKGNTLMADDKCREPTKRPAAAPKDQTEPRPEPRHIADEPIADADAPGAIVQSPTTETGLSVEDQVRREWDANKDGGLPLPLHDRAR
jgi:hypothetical protein